MCPLLTGVGTLLLNDLVASLYFISSQFWIIGFLQTRNVHVSSIEIFDVQHVETIGPGKAHPYERQKLLRALEYSDALLEGL